MLKQAKRASLAVGKACGVFQLVAGSRRRNSRLLIIGYHGVSLEDEHQWRPGLFLSPETFRSRLEALKRYECRVLALSEALDLLYRDQLPERAVALTFDDGTYDFRKIVCPMLREYGYPATLYLATHWVTVGRPVVPVIWSYLLWKRRGGTYAAPKLLGNDSRMDLATPANRAKVVQAIFDTADAKALNGAARDAVTQELAEILGIDYEEIHRKRLLHLIQPEEIRELPQFGVSVQLHTHGHQFLGDEQRFKRDLMRNRSFIGNLLGTRPEHFCYPGGQYDAKLFPWLRDLGIKSATTCDPALACPRTEPLLLPRLVDTSSLSTLEVEGWLVGIGELLPHRRGWQPAA